MRKHIGRQCGLSIGACITGSGPSEQEEEVLRESLLSSVEVDDGNEATEKKKQSLLKLCVLALAYVWPDTLGLKMRTLVAMFLLILMRGLNLMVVNPLTAFPSPL
jgi:hypothetical protein